jgi:hypothetical protein
MRWLGLGLRGIVKFFYSIHSKKITYLPLVSGTTKSVKKAPKRQTPLKVHGKHYTELVFLNLYGAQESMPRHQLRQPM